jgi:hypothetical protein
MDYRLSLWAHIAVGSLAMILFWATLLSAKGSLRHRRFGRPFFVVTLVTVLTVPPIVLLRPVPFDPGWIVSLAYLSVCVGTVVTLAWTAIRWKNQPERFRGPHLRVLGRSDPVAIVLSWVGLSFGAAMIHFARSRAALHPRWWLSWHVNAVLALFTAVHGTLLFVVWRALAVPEATRADAAAWHLAVLAAALVMRARISRQKALPWGFFERTPRTVQSAGSVRQP